MSRSSEKYRWMVGVFDMSDKCQLQPLWLVELWMIYPTWNNGQKPSVIQIVEPTKTLLNGMGTWRISILMTAKFQRIEEEEEQTESYLKAIQCNWPKIYQEYRNNWQNTIWNHKHIRLPFWIQCLPLTCSGLVLNYIHQSFVFDWTLFLDSWVFQLSFLSVFRNF